jgi:polar amino acid transport system permease protein
MNNFLETFFNWTYIKQVIPDLLATGLKNTIILAVSASVLGFVLAMILAVMGLSARWYFRLPARIFTDVFRGLPAILTILILGQGLAPLGMKMFGPSPYPLAILALGLITAAYTGEILRAGIQSVEKGQLEGARALGMTRNSAMLLVVIPQGIRRVLPSLVNQFIAVIKDSSLVYFLGLVADEREIFRIGQDAAVTNANLSPLVAAGILYLLMTVPLTHLINYIDKRLREGRPRPVAEPLIVVDGEAAPNQPVLMPTERH